MKFEDMKLKKLSRYQEETEGEDKVKHTAFFGNDKVSISVKKETPFTGLVTGQDYKVDFSTNQTKLVPEEKEEDVDKQSE